MTRPRPCPHDWNDQRCVHGCGWARSQELGPADDGRPERPRAEADIWLPKPDDPTVTVLVREGDPLPWPPPTS